MWTLLRARLRTGMWTLLRARLRTGVWASLWALLRTGVWAVLRAALRTLLRTLWPLWALLEPLRLDSTTLLASVLVRPELRRGLLGRMPWRLRRLWRLLRRL